MAKKKDKKKAQKIKWEALPGDVLRVDEDFDLASFDRGSNPGWPGDKDQAEEFMAYRGRLLSELQERYFANAKEGDERKVLLIVQGLDTAGKGGIARHVLGMVDPQGVQLASFGVPTEEEAAHDFLWRIERKLPVAGKIGLFDRSHYEAVLVERVDKLTPKKEWSQRYDIINEWEKKLVEEEGFTLIKVALMPSKAEQGVRLAERLARRDKWWKYNPNDIDTRAKWDDYQEAYQDVFTKTSTDWAPWYVIPADKKWYARLAVTELLVEALIGLDQHWPVKDWNYQVEKKRLLKTMEHGTKMLVREELEGRRAQVAAESKAFRKEVEAAKEGKISKAFRKLAVEE